MFLELIIGFLFFEIFLLWYLMSPHPYDTSIPMVDSEMQEFAKKVYIGKLLKEDPSVIYINRKWLYEMEQREPRLSVTVDGKFYYFGLQILPQDNDWWNTESKEEHRYFYIV